MKLRKDYLVSMIKHYGFTECGQTLSFLNNVCDEYPDEIDLNWIYGKVNQCIRANDNGNENGCFYGLERLMNDIESAFRDDSKTSNY